MDMTVFDNQNDHITSVSKFLDLNFSKFYTSDQDPEKWMFRGHGKYDFKLIPSVGRLLGNGIFNSKEKLFNFEESAFNEFRIDAYSELREANSFTLLAVAQHHGLKTRLLDWTFSALAALFFAVEDEKLWNEDGALIAFQSKLIFNLHAQKSKSPFDLENDYDFVYVPSLSPRIKAQQGIFQLFKDPTEEFLEAYNLGKVRILASSKEEIKNELEVLGVSHKTLFPDLDGLCKTINYNKLRSNPFSEK